MLWDRLRALFKDEERWSLSCDYHNWTIHDLSWQEARVILETLRDIEKSSVLVWRTGWPCWRNLREPECSILLNTRIVNLQAPSLPQSEDFDPEITAVRSTKTANPFLSRKHTRYEIRYPVTVVSGNQEFRTETVDMSEGGLRVRESLPDWVAGYCSVILHLEDGNNLEVMCSLAEDQKEGKSRLEIVASEKVEDYLRWFRSHPRAKG